MLFSYYLCLPVLTVLCLTWILSYLCVSKSSGILFVTWFASVFVTVNPLLSAPLQIPPPPLAGKKVNEHPLSFYLPSPSIINDRLYVLINHDY